MTGSCLSVRLARKLGVQTGYFMDEPKSEKVDGGYDLEFSMYPELIGPSVSVWLAKKMRVQA